MDLFQQHSLRRELDHTQQQSQVSRNAVESKADENAHMRIGAVLSNRKFICEERSCAGRTFARLTELLRHHSTIHDENKPNFWCHVPNCPRSLDTGGKAFHRKDKLAAHVKSKHS